LHVIVSGIVNVGNVGVTATNEIHSEILPQFNVSVMAVVGTNHMGLSKMAIPSKCKLAHSLLP
jgi:hypothetical protein